MLMPSIFGENLFDDFFDDYFPFDTDKELHKAEKKLYGRRAGHVMKTDIKGKDFFFLKRYDADVIVAGIVYLVQKKLPPYVKAKPLDIQVLTPMRKGLLGVERLNEVLQKYLNPQDAKKKEKETGKYIRKERYAGACTRSFYVGEEVDPGEIKAEFKHGILKLFVPKKEAKPAVEENKYIAIEG